jgi:hypothetical protein
MQALYLGEIVLYQICLKFAYETFSFQKRYYYKALGPTFSHLENLKGRKIINSAMW